MLVQLWVPADTGVAPSVASIMARTVNTPRILRILVFIDLYIFSL